jgi:hypothetical protein
MIGTGICAGIYRYFWGFLFFCFLLKEGAPEWYRKTEKSVGSTLNALQHAPRAQISIWTSCLTSVNVESHSKFVPEIVSGGDEGPWTSAEAIPGSFSWVDCPIKGPVLA